MAPLDDTTGCCPGCDLPGAVATPCGSAACRRRGLHHVPAAWVSDLDPARDPRLGRLVDDLLIVALLGVGGFGRVYLALQLPLGMLVALKIADPDAGRSRSGRAAPPLEREALALARLTHPNVVRLLRHGVWRDDGPTPLPFLVTEYIPSGHTLEAILADHAARRAGIPRDWAATILRQLLDGLGAAHAAGVVHRDVKPDNIMLQAVATDGAEGGGAPLVRLLDFGLAKLTGARAPTPRGPAPRPDDDDGGDADAGEVGMGTPTHMAPEQLHGGPIGPWTDLYAAGVMAFELLLGYAPFDGETLEDVLRQRHDLLFDPLATADALPEPCERFLRRALAFEPEDRFRDAAEMRAALELALPSWPAITDRAGRGSAGSARDGCRVGIRPPPPAPAPRRPPTTRPTNARGAARPTRLEAPRETLGGLEDAWFDDGEAPRGPGPNRGADGRDRRAAPAPMSDEAAAPTAHPLGARGSHAIARPQRAPDASLAWADADGDAPDARDLAATAFILRGRRIRLAAFASAAALLLGAGALTLAGDDAPPRPRAQITAEAAPPTSPAPPAAPSDPLSLAGPPGDPATPAAQATTTPSSGRSPASPDDAAALALLDRARHCALTASDRAGLAAACLPERGCVAVDVGSGLDRWSRLEPPTAEARTPVASVIFDFAPQPYDDARRCGARWRRGQAIVEGAWDEIPAQHGGYVRPQVAVELRRLGAPRRQAPTRLELTSRAADPAGLDALQRELASGATACAAAADLGAAQPFPMEIRAVEALDFRGVGVGYTGESGVNPCRLDLARVYVLSPAPGGRHAQGPAAALTAHVARAGAR